VPGQLLPIMFLPLKIKPYKNKSRHVLQQGRDKKHDRKTGRKGRPRGGFISKSIFFFQLKTLSVEKRKYVSLG
jgi:hypothetical protein